MAEIIFCCFYFTAASVPPLSLRSSHVMEATVESKHDDVVPLYTLNSPPLSPSSVTPFALPTKGVLKHSISQDSESSVVIVTKRVSLKKKGGGGGLCVTLPPCGIKCKNSIYTVCQ